MADNENKLIVGMSGCGKTRFAMAMAERAYRDHIGVIVLDPKLNIHPWKAHYATADPEEFLAVAKANGNSMLFIEEAQQTIGRHNPRMEVLATDVREAGNASVFSMQSLTMVSPTLRGQATEVFLFRCGAENGEYLQAIFPYPQLLDCATLPVVKREYSEFFWVRG